MAFFMLSCKSSSSSKQIYMSTLIVLVVVCSFSCCSSSPAYVFGSSIDDISKNVDDNDKDFYGQNNHDDPLPSRLSLSSSIHDINTIKHPTLSKSRFLNLLLDPGLIQEEDLSHRPHHDRFYNRRYAPQAFHAMRG
ncbi:unnamed protein product [Rotaria sordida]|uniref:Uncharacterized protein n=1 Tax=Rotaria sordida TaxID=392033 RepID=A0A814BKM4_9BILA|nr:unnamed protein product [Rotaria sordida]CAF1104918.1 unnamed protein product [Rotaria sordida]CAF3879742.1 unnamed protein product [Rotaria sordida]